MDIPQDIIENVIAAVGDDTQLLIKCCLVSSSFLLPSRKKLYSSITLRYNHIFPEIYQLLVQNPVIKSFVRTLTLKFEFRVPGSVTDKWVNGTSLLAILRLPFCCLERFSIIAPYEFGLKWSWNSFSSEVKDALLNIIHLSTLKTFSLEGVSKVPITFFHIVHLTTLKLGSISPYDFVGKNSSSLARAGSKGVVEPTASRTVVDRCVWCFKFKEEDSKDAKSIFIPFLCRLRFFEIQIIFDRSSGVNNLDVLSFLIDSLCISLTSPATLERLEFNIIFHDYWHPSFYEKLRDAWSHLGSITTYSTSSQLQRVDINIKNYRYGSWDDVFDEHIKGKIEKAVLDGLPLLRSEGILFVNVNSVNLFNG